MGLGSPPPAPGILVVETILGPRRTIPGNTPPSRAIPGIHPAPRPCKQDPALGTGASPLAPLTHRSPIYTMYGVENLTFSQNKLKEQARPHRRAQADFDPLHVAREQGGLDPSPSPLGGGAEDL